VPLLELRDIEGLGYILRPGLSKIRPLPCTGRSSRNQGKAETTRERQGMPLWTAPYLWRVTGLCRPPCLEPETTAHWYETAGSNSRQAGLELGYMRICGVLGYRYTGQAEECQWQLDFER
jgi:hypothetical protein